jgi:Fe-S-cluster containining protein
MIEREDELPGRRLERADPFPFRCGPGLACFNSCCRNKRLQLLPYDVLRLARGLALTTGAFLEAHAVLEIEPGSGWPALRIRLEPDGRCPFVGGEGCGVYGDRPTCCRIYPLARALRLGEGGEAVERFAVESTGQRCLGFGGEGAHTVDGWMRGQGLEPYQAANARVARLFLHPARPRPLALSDAGVHVVVQGLYDLDAFRALAGRPGFAERAGLSAGEVAAALASDDALLALGEAWVAARLFG